MTRAALLLPLALAACGEPAGPPAQTKAAPLQPGLYAVTSEVTQLKSADDGTPRVRFKQGDKTDAQVCIRSAGKAGIPAEAVAGAVAEGCEVTALLLPSGRITGQLACKPPGAGGEMSVQLGGTHRVDSYEVNADAATYLPTPGDVTATVRTAGRRVGDCPGAQS